MSVDFWAGMATGLALIVAIGSQNAFVLRCGIRREHVLPIVAFCAASDALLIATGGQARFFGTITPHIETLRRLIQSHAGNTGASKLPATVQALTRRLQQTTG